MKRIALVLLSVITLASCEDDPVVSTSTFPTDGLALPQVKNTLMMTSYMPMSGYSTQVFNIALADAFPGTYNGINLVNDGANVLYTAISDSIAWNQPLQAAPSLYLNDATVLDPSNLLEDVTKAQEKRPIAAVNHVVTNTDSAWVIDSKVQFFRDTTNAGFRIETYMLVNAIAANYPTAGINLTTNPSAGVMVTQNDLSVWDVEIFGLVDTTKALTTKGQPYYHQNVLVRNSNPESAWGYPFTEYSPFGQSFSDGDIIGTRTTPIRHYFGKPDSDIDGAFTADYEFTPSFITIIWVQNESTFKYEYVNSVLTELPLQ